MQVKTPPKTVSRIAVFTALLIGLLGCGQAVAAEDSTSVSREVSWLTHLANNGDSGAQLQLGLAYEHGRYGLQPDAETGYHWLRIAARNGNAYAADRVANHLAEEGPDDFHEAVALWKQAAQRGNADAQMRLGEFWMQQGDGQALDWLRKAAAQGNQRAQQDLLTLYRRMDLQELDLHRGENETAAVANEVGTVGLKFLVALWHVLEASSNYEQSKVPLMERAKQGDPIAEYQLALRYRNGAWDVNRDPEKSMSWLLRSVADGNRIARQDLEQMQQQTR